MAEAVSVKPGRKPVRRILLAALIAAIVAFAAYAIPRWAASRPRAYPKAYETATGILEEIFGRAAVQKGIVAIDDGPVSVPAYGRVYAEGAMTSKSLHMVIAPGYEAVLLDEGEGDGKKALRLIQEDARQVWATLVYLRRIRVANQDFAKDAESADEGTLYESDRAWPWAARKYEGTDEGESSASGVASGLAIEDYVQKLSKLPEASYVSDKVQIVEALRRLLTGAFKPKDSCDEKVLGELSPQYAKHAGIGALPFLRSVKKAYEDSETDSLGRLYGWPVVGHIAQWWSARRGGQRPRIPYVAKEVWRLENIEGKSPEETLRILADAAFPPDAPRAADSYSGEAWSILIEEYPAEYRRLLRQNVPSMDKSQSAGIDYLPENLNDVDNEYLEFVAEADSEYEGATALAELYARTKDARYVETLKSKVADAFSDVGGGIPASETYAMDALFRVYRANLSLEDIPAFAARYLGRFPKQAEGTDGSSTPDKSSLKGQDYQYEWLSERLSRSIIRGLAGTGAPLCMAPVARVLSEPEKVIQDGFDEDQVFRMRTTASESLLVLVDTSAVDALKSYLQSGRGDGERELVVNATVALGERADESVIPLLESIKGIAFRAHEADRNEEPGEQEREVVDSEIGTAMALIRLRTAEDPLAWYRSLGGSERDTLYAWHLARVFTTEQILGLVTDDAVADVRGRLICALYWRMYKDQLDSDCIECLDKCAMVRRLL